MIFNSFGFLSLFPIIFIIYYLTPAFLSKICKGENNFTKVGNHFNEKGATLFSQTISKEIKCSCEVKR